MTSLVAFAILVGFITALGKGLQMLVSSSRVSAKKPPSVATWQAPKTDGLPYSRNKYFFSAAERSFYEVLRRLAPEYTLFAKVGLADLVHVSKGASWWQSHFNRINQKHVDFVLCNRDLAPIAAIELDDSSHDADEREARDEFVDQVLAAAALPIVHIRARRAYAPDDLRAALHPFFPARPPSEIPHPDERYMPPQGWRPAL
jgi:Protein of unknown function (DUF2726)